MRINPDSFYFVLNPPPTAVDFQEVFVDAKRSLDDLRDLFEIYDTHEIYGIYANREQALKDAKALWEDASFEADIAKTKEKNLNEFVEQLNRISSYHGVAILDIENLIVFERPVDVYYVPNKKLNGLRTEWEYDQ